MSALHYPPWVSYHPPAPRRRTQKSPRFLQTVRAFTNAVQVSAAKPKEQPAACLLNVQLHECMEVCRRAPRALQHVLIAGCSVAGCTRGRVSRGKSQLVVKAAHLVPLRQPTITSSIDVHAPSCCSALEMRAAGQGRYKGRSSLGCLLWPHTSTWPRPPALAASR